MATMTSALQLTDTDFSNEFKSKGKRAVDMRMKQGAEKMRRMNQGDQNNTK